MRILLHIFLFSLLLLGNSCKKNNADEELPPLTFEGKNTIGCKINGEVWLPKGITNGSGITYPTSGGYFQTAFFPGVYILNKNTGGIHFGTGQIHNYGYYHTDGKTYFTDSLHNGWIDILKSDSVNKIISGRFEFDGYNSTDSKVYKITEGRFDYKNH